MSYILLIIGILAGFLEMVFYKGFVSKYLILPAEVIISVSALIIILIGKKIKYVGILIGIFVLVYTIFQTLEGVNFHNYVFNKYHINTESLLLIVSFLYIVVIGKKLKITGIFLFLIILAFIQNIPSTINQAYFNTVNAVFYRNKSYDQKMTDYWGLFYEYMQFVKSKTPESSKIIIPPQRSPWLTVGNGSLVRYFLYPRVLRQGNIDENKFVSGDYVLLVNDWPNAKKIEGEIQMMNNEWGIIKIK